MKRLFLVSQNGSHLIVNVNDETTFEQREGYTVIENALNYKIVQVQEKVSVIFNILNKNVVEA